jgi:integrase
MIVVPMSDELELALSKTREWLQDKIQSNPEFEAALSQRGYLAELYVFSDWRTDRPLSKELIDEYLQLLQRLGYSKDSVRCALAAIGWWLDRIREINAQDDAADPNTAEQIRRLIAQVRPSRKPRSSPPSSNRHISKTDLQIVMETCAGDASPLGVRDAAIAALLWATGINYASVTRLTIFDLREREPNVYSLAFKRSDKEEPTIDLPEKASQFLAHWLTLRGSNLGPLFYEIKGTDRILWGNRMTDGSVKSMLRQRLKQSDQALEEV